MVTILELININSENGGINFICNVVIFLTNLHCHNPVKRCNSCANPEKVTLPYVFIALCKHVEVDNIQGDAGL
jgi:hypothetical protein